MESLKTELHCHNIFSNGHVGTLEPIYDCNVTISKQLEQAYLAGLEPILDYSGKPDTFGKIMQVTAIAVADEICSASELVMGKVEKCPIAIVRNYDFSYSDVKIQKMLRSDHDDLFR